MPKLKDLKADFRRLKDEAKAVHAKAKTEDRDLADEEFAQVEKLLEEADEVREQISAAEERQAQASRLLEMERWGDTPPRQTPRDNPDHDGGRATVAPEQQGFASFGHMLQAVASAGTPGGRTDERLLSPMAATGLNEAIPSQGGFLVDAQTSTTLMQTTYETGQLASRCSRTPIGAGYNGLKINGIDETSRASGSQWGGITAYWTAEAASKTASKPKFRQVELNLHKLTGLCYATDELLQDATALETVIREGFPNVFAFELDDAIVRGTGAGQPQGILSGAVNAPRVRVSKETGQAATTIVAENIEKMYSRMWARGLNNAVWLINQDCWPQIFQLHHAVGTGGVPMFIPAGGLNQSPFGTLLGRPIIPTEQCATLGTEGDIIFGDFSQYMLIDKGGIEAASSMHVQFVYDEMVYRFVMRVDGQPLWASSLTPAQGSNTVSPFVTLQTRS